MPIDFEEDTSAKAVPKIDFQEDPAAKINFQEDKSAKPDWISRLFNALSRAPASQREEARIQTEFAAKDNPLITISPEAVRTVSGNLGALSLISPSAAKGISEEVASAVTGLTKPSNLALIPAAMVAPHIVAGVLTGMGVESAVEAAAQASVAINQGDTEEAAKLLTRTALSTGQALIAPAMGLKAAGDAAIKAAGDILPASGEAVAQFEKGEGSPPISSISRLLPAPRTRMPEFQDSTLGVDRNQKSLPSPGESGATAGLLPESPLGPRTAGYRIKVAPFEERPIIELDPATPEAVDNLRNLVQISERIEPTGAGQFKAPEVSTDLRQLQGVMQRNSISTLENWADGVIKDKLGESSANPYLDPEFMSAALVKSTVLIKRGATKAADIYAPLVDQFGRDIIPHIPELYKAANEAASGASSEPVNLSMRPPIINGTAIPSSSSTPLQSSFGTTASPLESFSDSVRSVWRSAANEAMPKITEANRDVGEAGVRSVTARMVGRDMGEIFADKVLRDLDVDPAELGAFAAEDNLRWREDDFRQQAAEAVKRGDSEDAAILHEAADAVGTIVGTKGSPFQTHEDFLKYWEQPEVQEAARRHIEMWKEQKDPLFRQANDLDPETPLPSRGLISGMRVNMKGIMEGEKSPTALPVRNSAAGMERIGESEPSSSGGRSTLIRQMATLKKSDPFNRTFTGLAPAYETHYYELMRNGFGRELPVAAQHEFIRKMIASGGAVVTDRSFEPELSLKGEETVGRLLKLNPWAGGSAKFLQVRKSLASEYDNATGLTPSLALPGLKQAGDILTRASVAGLAEGTTHEANLLSQVITGAGPTSNPLLNGLIKAFSGRADLLYSIPRVFIRAMTASKEEMVQLMAEGAAKEPYNRIDPAAPAWKQFLQKYSLGHLLLDPTDRGVRLVAKDQYDNFVKAGWITEASETARREYVNQVGNYNRALQPVWMRALRDNVQPFVTAVHTFNVQGLRRMAGSAGIRDLTPAQRVAFAADIYGGWLGMVTLVCGLNWLLNKHKGGSIKDQVRGPTGTKLGEVGWIDSEGKLRTVNVLRIAGYERGLRATGILPAAESFSRGLGGNAAIDAAGTSIANTASGYVTGPLVRAASVVATGKTPSIPSYQEAPVVPPQDDFNPLKTQLASNIGTAVKEANPLIDSAISLAKGIHEGHTGQQLMDEAGKKQLSRYYPGQKSAVAQSEDFAKIITKAKLNDFVDDLARRARKLPEDQRRQFVEDNVPDEHRVEVNKKLKQKGVFKPDK